MPVKWTPDNDQLLLLKILETHDISVDAKKISAAWPSEKGEVPTARAITERLVKIRQLARANGAGHFGISSSQAKSSSGKPGTPRKPLHMLQASQPIPTTPGTMSLGSRSDSTPCRNGLDDYDDEDDDEDDDDERCRAADASISPSKRKHDALLGEREKSAAQVKVESIETDGFEIMEDGSSFGSATRSPSMARGLQRNRAVLSGAGGASAQSFSQLRVDDDGSPAKRLRLEHARAERLGTESEGDGIGDPLGSGRRAQTFDGYVDEDQDDDAV